MADGTNPNDASHKAADTPPAPQAANAHADKLVDAAYAKPNDATAVKDAAAQPSDRALDKVKCC